MKISYLWSSLVLLLSVTRTFSACRQYWSGTAPFCKGSCPSGCITLESSERGNGAYCATGSKKLCDCCSTTDVREGPCTPNHTETFCFPISTFPFGVPVGVLICKD